MIRYELKDKERQAVWEKAFPGFARDLQAACDEQFDDKFSYVRVRLTCARILYCDGSLDIKKKAIRTKEGYDPHAWNNYPEVTPPEDISLRCEGHDRDTGRPFRAILRYLDGGFCFDSTDPRFYRSLFPGMVIDRFRPWDEEDEE